MSKKTTYKSSGVDVNAGNAFVKSIKKMINETHRPEVIDSIGGFGGLFQPDFSNFKKPVLVSSVDGVGTKLKVAIKAGVYDTIGQDLVNHCVNDIAVCGAEPLFFLDYFSTGKLEQETGYDILKGFAIACKENGCALIGGETAEMPDIYADGEFDIAGTIVGVVDRDKILDGSASEKGDIIYGITGKGLHTNGYSLARNILFPAYHVDDFVEEIGMTIGECLLQIHPSYLPFINKIKSIKGVKGFAHITGGGIVENTRRILPNGLRLSISWKNWQWPPIFSLIEKKGKVPLEDMRQAFNLGIGLTIIASENSETMIFDACNSDVFKVIPIGVVE